MREPRSAVLLLAALVAAACSGSRDKVEFAAIYTLSGTAFAAGGTAADGDTGDRDPSAPVGRDNDSIAAAQLLPSAVTLGGWVSSLDDPSDYYRATLAQGQVVRLVPTDGMGELDLELFVAGVSTTVSANDGFRAVETITVPADGEYHVRVFARASSGTYQLTIGPAASGAAAPAVERGLDDGELTDAEFVPGQVIVRFQDLPRGHPADTLEERARAVGLVPVAGGARREMLMEIGRGSDRARAVRTLGLPEVAADAPGDPAGRKADAVRAVKALRARADVKHADLNYVVHASTEPDDPLYAQQWQYPLIKLPQAWEITTGVPEAGDVVVAVVDTGVVPTHPDLVGKLVAGRDFVSDPASADDGDGWDLDPTDPGDSRTPGMSSWHGTHVAGTIGAASGNGAGVAGVSWGAKVMPVRVLGLGGSGEMYDVYQGVRWAAGLDNDSGTHPQQKADVINLSLGCSDCASQTGQLVFDEVHAAGVVVAAAAGNAPTGVATYPASHEHVISVSAVDFHGRRAPYSNYGPKVDVAAPGGSGTHLVLSTAADDSSGAAQPAYTSLQGTSMATPHVAGVVALMKAVCPTLGPERVDAFLQSGQMTMEAGAAGRDDYYGWGIIDALGSVQSAQAECGKPVPALIDVDPARLDFAPSALTTAVLTVSKSGTGSLAGSVTTATSGAWLTVAPAGVDAEGLGTYVATVDPTVVSTGAYVGSVTFTAGPQVLRVPVTMTVGGAGGGGDAGHVYFLLIDGTFNVLDVRAADPVAGAYPYSFPVSAGTYFVVAGSDLDGDDWICEPGESCGAYPTGDLLTEISAGGDRSGLDFRIGFDVAIGAGASSWLPPDGLPVRAGAVRRR